MHLGLFNLANDARDTTFRRGLFHHLKSFNSAWGLFGWGAGKLVGGLYSSGTCEQASLLLSVLYIVEEIIFSKLTIHDMVLHFQLI